MLSRGCIMLAEEGFVSCESAEAEGDILLKKIQCAYAILRLTIEASWVTGRHALPLCQKLPRSRRCDGRPVG